MLVANEQELWRQVVTSATATKARDNVIAGRSRHLIRKRTFPPLYLIELLTPPPTRTDLAEIGQPRV